MEYIPAQSAGLMRAGPDKGRCAPGLGMGDTKRCGETERCSNKNENRKLKYLFCVVRKWTRDHLLNKKYVQGL